jgi:hypothetical protein
VRAWGGWCNYMRCCSRKLDIPMDSGKNWGANTLEVRLCCWKIKLVEDLLIGRSVHVNEMVTKSPPMKRHYIRLVLNDQTPPIHATTHIVNQNIHKNARSMKHGAWMLFPPSLPSLPRIAVLLPHLFQDIHFRLQRQRHGAPPPKPSLDQPPYLAIEPFPGLPP